MSLKHALLGFLNYGPMTGYELKKFFDTSVAHFWNAELSQIYPTLKQLECDGLVEMKVEVQEDRPNRKVYTITLDGRDELLDWLARPAESEQLREPLLIKVFFGAVLPKEQILKVLRQRVELMKAGIEGYEHGRTVIRQFAEAVGLQREALFWDLTIDSGIRNCRMSIDWAETAIRTIEQADDSLFPPAPAAPGHMDVRAAVEVLDRIKTAMPQAFHSFHHPEAADASGEAVDAPHV